MMGGRSILRQGLPGWMVSWPAAVAFTCGFIPLCFMLLAESARLFEPPLSTHAPSCFVAENQRLVAAGTKSYAQSGSYKQVVQAERRKTLDALEMAADSCARGSCDRRARSALQAAAVGYVFTQGKMLQRMYATFGSDGMDYVREVYGTESDRRALATIRDRFAAGQVTVEGLGWGAEGIMRMVLFKPDEPLTLCTRDLGQR